ncbi:MAG: hypothetical protein SFV51_17115 [Bryobacteraceae bacterium]|nr:hypothetical protein [Bryobacteraceae bacterium]
MNRIVFFLGAAAAFAAAQDFTEILTGASKQASRNAKVTGMRFNCAQADCKVRPFETMPVQVMVDGEVATRDGEPLKGRIRRAPGRVRVVEKDGGAVSKPFKFQGKDEGKFVETSSGGLASIFSKVSSDFTVFDTVLYVAPEKPGTYTLECETDGIRAEQKVIVDASAPSNVKPEEISFKPEDKSGEKYRALAERYAPVFAQETWWMPKADFPTRWDYDNDLAGDNNWDNMEKGTSQAYIYYAVMETPTHWFLIYNAFHPRDYSDKCLAGSCHENDNEGAILVVHKDGSEFGKLLAMETLAHNNLYSYTADNSVRSGIHSVEGRMELRDGTHPVIFIESGGHGMYGGNDSKHGRYRSDTDSFTSGTGVTFVYKGVAERPRHPNDRNVGYELLPILTHWWARAGSDQERMFDEFGPYEPWGGRPGAKLERMGKTFLGRKESSNKAKPFWGWHDNKTLKAKVLNAGQWGMDPAYAYSRNLTFPQSMAWSLDYTYNPYLGIGEESTAAAAAPAVDVKTPAAAQQVTPTATGASASILPALGAAATEPAAQASEGWIDVEATVDGSAVFHAFEQTVTPEILAGQPVAGQKVQFSGPVPSGEGITWTVEKKSGRGKIAIAEQPSASNGNTLLVRVDDPSRGAGKYVFRIRWKR